MLRLLDVRLIIFFWVVLNCKFGFKVVLLFFVCMLRILIIWLLMIMELGFEVRLWNVLSNGFIILFFVVYLLLCFFKVLFEGFFKFGFIVFGVNIFFFFILCYIGFCIILIVFWLFNYLRVLKNLMILGFYEYFEGVIYICRIFLRYL